MPRAVERTSKITEGKIRGTAGEHSQSIQSITGKPPDSDTPIEFSLQSALSNLADIAFLRLPEVKAMTGLSKSSLYALIKEKSFPAPVRLGARSVAWVKSEVRQWATERVHASRSVA